MKRKYPRFGIILIIAIATITACLTVYGVFAASLPAPQNSGLSTTNASQQDLLNDVTTNLINYGVPVKSVEIYNDTKWNPAIVIKYILQSSSQDDVVAPNDPIYLNLVGHEINLAKEMGLNVGAINTTLINTNGKILYITSLYIAFK